MASSFMINIYDMKRIKYCCFYTLAVILLYMAAGTILEKIYGTDFAQEKVYHSPVFIILWTFAAISGGWYFFPLYTV